MIIIANIKGVDELGKKVDQGCHIYNILIVFGTFYCDGYVAGLKRLRDSFFRKPLIKSLTLIFFLCLPSSSSFFFCYSIDWSFF